MVARLTAVAVAALAVAAVAHAAQPRDGSFKGTTSQKQKVTLQVLEGAISVFDVTVKCGGKARQATSFPAVKVTASGAFTIKDGVAGLTVTGTFATPTSARGKVTLKGPGCKPVTFTAKR
jgi:hypothetical protein